MISNFFKTTIRNLWRNKGFSIINIAGLSIGLACVIFIALYVQDELSYDKFLKNADRICQVNLDGNIGGQHSVPFQFTGSWPAWGKNKVVTELLLRHHRFYDD